MGMNRIHRRLCSSKKWADRVEQKLLPWSLDGIELGDHALEIGPGYGANLRVLVELVPKLTGLEISAELLAGLEPEFGNRARLVHGDGAAMPFADNEFSSVVCFTMLHHVPTARRQDELFAEALRVVRPGGVFAGSDSLRRLRFRVIHIGDTCIPVSPDALPRRLRDAGFVDVEVGTRENCLRFRGRKPAW